MRMRRGRAGVEYEDTELGEGSTAERGCTVEVEYSLFLNRGDQEPCPMGFESERGA